MWDFTWRLSDCEELVGVYLEFVWLCEELSGGLLTGDDGVGFSVVIVLFNFSIQ